MSLISGIAAEADKNPQPGFPHGIPEAMGMREDGECQDAEESPLPGLPGSRLRAPSRKDYVAAAEHIPAHQFPARKSFRVRLRENSIPESPLSAKEAGNGAALENEPALGCVSAGAEQYRDREQERRTYRVRTVAMLRRYMRYSIETGRLPSLVGREFFRSRITPYRVTTLEDRVIFVHDMERCLERLDGFAREVLGRVVLQEYEHEEAARLLGCTRMTVHRRLAEALDRLSDILLEVGLLDALPSVAPTPFSSGERNPCQEGEEDDSLLSDCDQ